MNALNAVVLSDGFLYTVASCGAALIVGTFVYAIRHKDSR